MNKKYIGVAQTVIRTSDIKKIENLICDELNCGDVVIKVSKTCEQETYQVIQKSSDKLAFCYVDDEKAIIVKYEKVDGVWAWKSTNETSIGNPFTPEESENLKNGFIKTGTYILDEDDNYVHVEEMPEDYSGICITVGDDGYVYIQTYNNGVYSEGFELSPSAIVFYNDVSQKSAIMTADGVNKVSPSALEGLTHSFDELTPAVKTIVDNAILEYGEVGVACTEEQWSEINELLDKSLYLNYNDTLLIKSTVREDGYIFGFHVESSTLYGGIYCMEIRYDEGDELLYARCYEM